VYRAIAMAVLCSVAPVPGSWAATIVSTLGASDTSQITNGVQNTKNWSSFQCIGPSMNRFNTGPKRILVWPFVAGHRRECPLAKRPERKEAPLARGHRNPT
jgi:hypothetical protein